jgi:hypothetical protein
VLLTGTTLRWEERTRVWREGWRNLHHDGPAEVAARLRIDGEPGLLELNRRWAPGQALEAGDLNVTGARSSWAQLGWDRPLEQFRPLLSYNELGTMFSTRAAALYEALSAVLGLEDFDALLNTLRQERLAREKTGKDEKALRERVLAVVRGSEDPRAALLEPLILSRRPDLEDVSRHLESADVPPGSDPRALAALEVPTPEAVQSAFEGLAAARHAVERLLTGDSDRLDALAELLERGLTYHRHHGATPPADCPLCGTADAIDASWAQRTEAAAQDLRARSRELREARAELAAALNAAKTLFPNGIDTVLDRASEAGIDTAPALQAWQAWRETCTGDDAAVRDRGAQTATALSRALSQAREAAGWSRRSRRPRRGSPGRWRCCAGNAWRRSSMGRMRTGRCCATKVTWRWAAWSSKSRATSALPPLTWRSMAATLRRLA